MDPAGLRLQHPAPLLPPSCVNSVNRCPSQGSASADYMAAPLEQARARQAALVSARRWCSTRMCKATASGQVGEGGWRGSELGTGASMRTKGKATSEEAVQVRRARGGVHQRGHAGCTAGQGAMKATRWLPKQSEMIIKRSGRSRRRRRHRRRRPPLPEPCALHAGRLAPRGQQGGQRR